MKKNRLIVLALAAVLMFTGCSFGGKKDFTIGNTKVSFDKTRRFYYMEYPIPTALEEDEDRTIETWTYRLKEDGKLVYKYSVHSIFILFSRTPVEEDMTNETSNPDVKDVKTSTMKLSGKEWAVIEYTKYNEEFGRDTKYRVYYVVHTVVSETNCIKVKFENADEYTEYEKAFLKAMKFK